ncbi:MAG: hypothetical protein OXB93_02495, partial [Cytophagales bacterium]|nr:hypothetical protein [Cytophagales bacterium]
MAKQDIKEQVRKALLDLRSPWLQKAYWMLYNSPDNKLTKEQEDTLVDECLKGTASPSQEPLDSEQEQESSNTKPKEIVIKGIGNIKNINRLTNEGLSFEDRLNIIYGANGSGKTGYTRILNKACGNKFGDWRLIGNIDKKQEESKKFTITCEIEGKDGELQYEDKDDKLRYEEEGTVIIDKEKELKNVNIFDKIVAKQYTDEFKRALKDGLVPRRISLFKQLRDVCGSVGNKIKEKQTALYKKIIEGDNYTFTEDKLKENLDKEPQDNKWSDEKEKELGEKNKLLAESDPEREFKRKKGELEDIEKLNEKIEEDLKRFSDGNMRQLKKLKGKYEQYAKEAKDTITAIKSSLPIPEAGSEIWRKMWESAREFAKEVHGESHEEVYGKKRTDPNILQCMLCQQDIGDEGKRRLEYLEDHVQNKANKKADSAKKYYENFLKQLKIEPSTRSYQEDLKKFEESTQQKLRGILEKFHYECEKRYKIICDEDFSKISSSANTNFSQISETLKASLNKTMEKIKKEETNWQRILGNREKVEEECVNLSLGKFLNDI